MMDHCLTILHKCNKRACFLNKKKLLQVYKATDFPRDFTNFYGDWGKWDETVWVFLNTIPADKSRSFMGSFYFRCEWDPAQLFEKILQKMASQRKYKGTITTKLKPCQHLHTSRDIIFFSLPFCSDKSLLGTLRKAMTKQKSTLIKGHPSKYPRMEWGPPLPDFVMVRDFVRNTPWRNREEKTTIQAYHKIAWHMKCPSLDVQTVYNIEGDEEKQIDPQTPGIRPLAHKEPRAKCDTSSEAATGQRCSLSHVLSDVGQSRDTTGPRQSRQIGYD
jgi:hypothetical protein